MKSRLCTISKNPGFTLVELLIVVALIAILTAIAIPQYSSRRAKASNSAAQSDLTNLKVAFESFFSDHGSYPASLH